MYYEEKVIDGVLCWRGRPDGEWTQYTPEELTTALISERAIADSISESFTRHLKNQQLIGDRNET